MRCEKSVISNAWFLMERRPHSFIKTLKNLSTRPQVMQYGTEKRVSQTVTATYLSKSHLTNESDEILDAASHYL